MLKFSFKAWLASLLSICSATLAAQYCPTSPVLLNTSPVEPNRIHISPTPSLCGGGSHPYWIDYGSTRKRLFWEQSPFFTATYQSRLIGVTPDYSYMSNNGLLDAQGAVLGEQTFGRMFIVNRADVEQLRADFADNGIINNTLNVALLEWPGRNNPHFSSLFGFALPPNEDLAPFVDVNHDGTYNPMLGDYPIAMPNYPNLIANQLAWSVSHTKICLTDSSTALAQFEQLYYGFGCTNDTLLNSTLFSRVRIKNKSADTLHNFRLGLWADAWISCTGQHYFGSNWYSNSCFYYFGDTSTTLGMCQGSNPPVVSLTLLNHPLYAAIYHLGSSSAGRRGEPYSMIHWDRLLQGLWLDGTPLTVGGTGDNPSGTQVTRYVFPDNPNFSGGWSCYANGTTGGGDFRTINSIAARDLAPQEQVELEYAIAYHQDPANASAPEPHIANVQTMYSNVARLRNLYNNPNSISCAQSTYCTNNCVWPGDADNNGWVDMRDAVYTQIGLNTTGTARPNPISTVWQGQSATNWTQNIPAVNNLNYKYLDCDGNGHIDTFDQDISTEQNYGQHRVSYAPVYTSGNELYFERSYASLGAGFHTSPDTILQRHAQNGFRIQLRVHGNFPDVVALSYKLEYNPYVMGIYYNIPPLRYAASQPYNTLYEGNEYVHLNSTGLVDTQLLNDQFFYLQYTAPMTQSIESSTIRLKDILAIRADGSQVPMGSQDFVIQYTDSTYTSVIKTDDNLGLMNIFPNPTQGTFTFQWTSGAELIGTGNCSYSIINKLGQVIDYQLLTDVTTTITLNNNLPNDVYLLLIQTPKGIVTHKLLLDK